VRLRGAPTGPTGKRERPFPEQLDGAAASESSVEGLRCIPPGGITIYIPTGGMEDGEAMGTRTVAVKGMTCGHCVSSMSQELRRLPGVESVEIDLASGRVAITSSQDIDDDAVRTAVDEAGYEVAS
jgi:copper chaperone